MLGHGWNRSWKAESVRGCVTAVRRDRTCWAHLSCRVHANWTRWRRAACSVFEFCGRGGGDSGSGLVQCASVPVWCAAGEEFCRSPHHIALLTSPYLTSPHLTTPHLPACTTPRRCSASPAASRLQPCALTPGLLSHAAHNSFTASCTSSCTSETVSLIQNRSTHQPATSSPDHQHHHRPLRCPTLPPPHIHTSRTPSSMMPVRSFSYGPDSSSQSNMNAKKRKRGPDADSTLRHAHHHVYSLHLC